MPTGMSLNQKSNQIKYNDQQYMENLTDSISNIAANYKNSTLWFGSDL